MAKIEGFEDISRQLSALGAAAGGKSLKASAMSAMLPALQAARAAIPVGDPPYHEGSGVRRGAGGTTTYGTGTVRTVDPYPVRGKDGPLRTPGYAKRSLRRKAVLSDDKTRVIVMVGVLNPAWYATSYVELGTSKMAKRPWLEPSFRGAVGAVGEKLADELRDRLDTAATTGRIEQNDVGEDA